MTDKPYLEVNGPCPICQCDVLFRAYDSWLRDSFLCESCGSIPRERAIFSIIEMFYLHWRNLQIHETSPAIRATSLKLKTECPGYTYSHYNELMALGSVHPEEGYRCENIERMTFENDSFDLFISQDVFEHIFHPDRAIKEIERILKPGGAYIMTVPLVMKSNVSQRRASIDANGNLIYLKDAQYHGNPINDKGALVTIDWGFDILSYLNYYSSLQCTMIYIDDLSRGIRAEFIEVVLCMKGKIPSL